MNIIKATDFGVFPGREISQELVRLFETLKNSTDTRKVLFEGGTYYIDGEKCVKRMLFITNTVGDREFSKGEIPHQNAAAFYLNGLENIVIDGADSIFYIDGKVTNIAVENCRNITLKNMEIRHVHPDMHELRVVRNSLFSVELKLDSDTQYGFKNGKLYFYGNGYHAAAGTNALNAHWIGLIRKKTPNKLKRVQHPLFGALRMRDLGEGRFRMLHLNALRFKEGDRFYLFDVRRQFAGIFVNRCDNVCLNNIKQRFNYSLALVAQDSKDITLKNSEFAPEPGSVRKMASVADFIQVCMCRGSFKADTCYFDGAGDDCLNVHGIHFKIMDKRKDTVTVRFMHPQTHGFNPLRVGDKIAFISPETLLESGRTEILKSELINETDIRLELYSGEKAAVGEVIEDIDACPDVEFTGNTLTRIITRGLLLTTRGKVHVANNRFISTTMSGILLSDDAKSWYESGMCKDVLIENNTFEYCGETPVRIKPENSVHAGAVHKNIVIKNNSFKKYNGYCITAKSTDKITTRGNSYHGKKHIKAINCTNVEVE